MSAMSPNIKSYQWLDQRHASPEVISLPAGEAVVFSHHAPEKETANEDGALLISVDEHRAVLAVADGCGGMSRGDQAARLTLTALSRDVNKSLKKGAGMRAAILDGVENANAKVVSLATGAGATLAVAEVRDGRIRPYHVGDAQILLVGSRGKVKLQTCAHSPVGYAQEAGMLSEEEAIHHDERHVVSNVIGARDGYIEIGYRRKLSKRDTLLVASDGVFDNLHLHEIVDLIRKETASRSCDMPRRSRPDTHAIV